MNRYQKLANQLKEQIRSNTWRAGEKIPSIRAASKSFAVSSATVLQAYQLLESEGWLSAKPQSGYFVTALLERNVLDDSATPELPKFDDTLFEFLKANGEAKVSLGSAFPDPNLFPIATLNRHLASAGRKMTAANVASNLPPGNEDLRRVIAQRYVSQGVDVTYQDIVLTSGALEALNLSLQVVTQPGDRVLIESPTFYGAIQAVERLGLEPVEIDVDPESGVCLEELESIFNNQKVKAFWLMPNFHNPTGSTLSEDKKQAIVRLAEQHEVVLIEDDVYSELYFSGDKPKPLKWWDRQDRVLLCGSLSKSLCPGYRIGWVVNKRLNQPIQKQQLISTLAGSAPIQQGIAHYLTYESFDKHLRQLRKTLEARQQFVVTYLEEALGDALKISVPKGGYFIWVALPQEIDSHAVYQALATKGITVAFGQLFSGQQAFSHYLRVNTSFEPNDDTKWALDQLVRELSK